MKPTTLIMLILLVTIAYLGIRLQDQRMEIRFLTSQLAAEYMRGGE